MKAEKILLAVLLSWHGHLLIAQSSEQSDSLENQLTLIQEKYYYTNMDSALMLFQQVADVAEKNNLVSVQLSALLNMAWCSLDYHELERFQQYISQGNKLMKKQSGKLDALDPDFGLRSQLIYTSGMFYYTLGQFGQAIDEFSSIFQRKSPSIPLDSIITFNTYTSIGKSYFNLGNYDKAIETYREAFAVIPKKSDSYFGAIDYDYYYALNRSQVGEAHFKKGLEDSESFRQAFPYLYSAARALRLKKIDGSIKNLVLTNYNRLAAIHQHAQNYDSALHYLQKSLDIQPKNDIEFTKTYVFLGDIYLALKEYEKSLAYYQMRLDRLNVLYPGRHYAKGIADYHIGSVYEARAKFTEALQYYQEAIIQLSTDFSTKDILSNPSVSHSDINTAHELIQVLSLKARCLKELYYQNETSTYLTASVATYDLIVMLIDRMRKEFPSKDFKEFIASKSAALYHDAMDAAYLAHEISNDISFVEKAFSYSEKSKSLLLLEATLNLQAKSFSGIPDSLLQRESDLQGSILYLTGEVFKSTDEEDAVKLRRKIASLNTSYEGLVQRLEKNYPEYYNLRHKTAQYSWQQVSSELLKRDGAFIEYALGKDHTFAFVIMPGQIVLKKLRHHTDLLATILDLRESLHANDPEMFMRSSHAVYKSLFSEIDSLLKQKAISKVTIVPDGYLHYIPFEILISSKSDLATPYKDLDYLIRDYAIHYQYSVALAFESQVVRKGNSTKGMLGFAPDFSVNESRGSQGQQALPGSRQELERIAGIFSGTYLSATDATKEKFKELGPDYQIIHLATHGVLHDQHPGLSKLVFSRGDGGDESLYSYELYNMHLRAELVTLSACNTGFGKLQRGEGLQSLARGFMYAGCPNVMMSLWTAPDQATASLMADFYEGIKSGLPKDEALRKAKLQYLEAADPLMANPYLWSSFIFVGNPEPIELGFTWWKIMIAGLLGIVVIGFSLQYFVLKRKKNAQ
jgi:CHAT domain-containing protein